MIAWYFISILPLDRFVRLDRCFVLAVIFHSRKRVFWWSYIIIIIFRRILHHHHHHRRRLTWRALEILLKSREVIWPQIADALRKMMKNVTTTTAAPQWSLPSQQQWRIFWNLWRVYHLASCGALLGSEFWLTRAHPVGNLMFFDAMPSTSSSSSSSSSSWIDVVVAPKLKGNH